MMLEKTNCGKFIMWMKRLVSLKTRVFQSGVVFVSFSMGSLKTSKLEYFYIFRTSRCITIDVP